MKETAIVTTLTITSIAVTILPLLQIIAAYVAGGFSFGVNNNTSYIINIRRRGTTNVDLYINGVYNTSGTLTANNAMNFQYMLNDLAGDYTKVYVGTLAAIINPIDSEVNNAVSILKTQYGI